MMLVSAGNTQFVGTVMLANDDGAAITGVAFDNGDLVVQSRKQSQSAWSDITLVAGTLGTFVANSWVEIGEGLYQLCLHSNLLPTTGVNTELRLQYSTFEPQFDSIQVIAVELDSATAAKIDAIPKVGQTKRYTQVASGATTTDVSIGEAT